MYFELILGLLGEEITEDVKIRAMLLKEDVEQLDLFLRPYFRLLFTIARVIARNRISLACCCFAFGFFLPQTIVTMNSMVSIKLPSVGLEAVTANICFSSLLGLSIYMWRLIYNGQQSLNL
jgi:hypothetical protein